MASLYPDANSAHQFALGTYNFYLNQFGRNGIDENNMPILSTVQYQSGYQNASWIGSLMLYGDGYGFAHADDIVAHELTHGVTQYESNLLYFYQSGAINESFSDIWGELVDLTNGKGNDDLSVKWYMGEDTSFGAMRNMANPPEFGDHHEIGEFAAGHDCALLKWGASSVRSAWRAR